MLPNEELAGDIGAALAVCVRVGMVISEINAIAAMNFFMTHLLVLYCNCRTAEGHMRCSQQ